MGTTAMNLPRRIFFDLGAYNGDTIEVALQHLGDFDDVYAFEPLAGPFAEMERRFPSDKYHFYRLAGDIEESETRVYVGHAHGDISSSLHIDNPNCNSADYQEIRTIDFPGFLSETCAKHGGNCYVILKMNIEGSEYRILERLLENGSINLVNKLYCDWHWYFVGISEVEHHNLVYRLRMHGHNLCGDKPDELYHASRNSSSKVSWEKFRTYHGRSIKLLLKTRVPNVFRVLKKLRSWLTGNPSLEPNS
jgi:FkbM family methyltransferase